MKSNRRHAVWPYLGILAGLFALSVTAPRNWEQTTRQKSLDLVAALPDRNEASVQVAEAPVPPADEAPPVIASQPPEPEPELSAPRTEISADQMRADSPTPADPQPQLAGPIEAPATPLASGSLKNDVLALIPARAAPNLPQSLPDLQSQRSNRVAPGEKPQRTVHWTPPAALLAALDKLAAETAAGDWPGKTAHLVRRLTSTPAEATDQSAAIVSELRTSAADMAAQLRHTTDEELRKRLLRARYALVRRLDVWELIFGGHALAERKGTPTSRRALALAQPLSEVAALTATSSMGSRWREYLMLDALRAASEQRSKTTDDERRQLAGRVLRRLDSAQLSSRQRRFVEQGPVAVLHAALRTWTAEPVDVRHLLAHVEAFEQTQASGDARRVAEGLRSLTWSADAGERAVAQEIERHYRNANVRCSISAALLNRGLPTPQTIRAAVNDTILGAEVEGTSNTTSRLAVRLLPDADRLRIVLEARGFVESDTESTRGPATIYSEGQTTFVARKEIKFGPRGLRTEPAVATADSDNYLQGFDTSWDGIPLIKGVVRGAVQRKHDESQDEARREVEQKVSRIARQRLDREAALQLQRATVRFQQTILAPLARLSIKPEPLDMSTTSERMAMRLRLAGPSQLGAQTPRPVALSSSLASVQLHESAVNNLAEQFELDGQAYELPALYRMIAERLGRAGEPPEDLSADTRITFAEEDAVQIHFREGRVAITLAVQEIISPGGRFPDIKVHAFYRPESSGLELRLVRDGSIRLQGRRVNFRSRVALLGVFNTLFARKRPIVIVSPERAQDRHLAGLEFHQVVLEDGWLGLAAGAKRRSQDANVASRAH